MPTYANIILLIILLTLVFGYIQCTVPWLIGYDGYFHIKIAELLRDKWFIEKLPWLEFTI